jgi:hypothetical protein
MRSNAEVPTAIPKPWTKAGTAGCASGAPSRWRTGSSCPPVTSFVSDRAIARSGSAAILVCRALAVTPTRTEPTTPRPMEVPA